MKVSMWQLDSDATKASSGSMLAGFEYGAGTTDGDDEAGTERPPSNVQVCSRENFPLRKSPLTFQATRARCCDMGGEIIARNLSDAAHFARRRPRSRRRSMADSADDKGLRAVFLRDRAGWRRRLRQAWFHPPARRAQR